jgi:two-component system LytT family sensor kinase
MEMIYVLELFSHLLNNLGYVIVIAFFLSKFKVFQKIMEKEKFGKKDKWILSLVFSAMAILGTYVGVDYQGAIANTRNIGVIVGGILCGPVVGITAGIVAAIHRVLIDLGGITAVPCAIATTVGGVLSGLLYKKAKIKNRYIYGFVCGVIVENLSMLMILIMSRPFYIALDIVKKIYVPMVLINAVGVSVVILITENIMKEKEKLAGEQAKLALEIANKTLPYFREINSDSLKNVCKTILESLDAKVVVLTDQKNILAHYSSEEEFEITHRDIVGEATKEVLRTGNILIADKKDDDQNFGCTIEKVKSAIIAPLKEKEGVIGTLKIYFDKNSYLTSRNKYLVIGLSQLISTQLEISKIEKLKEMANKAEIKALQAQINPHFLFNALHTITSFVRVNPAKARDMIIDLSTYLRYNLEKIGQLVDMERELEQVRAYVNIEKARFSHKLEIHYDIEEGLESFKIPSLTVQPLVENSIKHGILKHGTGKNIYISIKKRSDGVKIVIEDDGIGISQDIIEKIYNDNMPENKIGLYNVHLRLKLIYGTGLLIERLNPGTRISFEIR